MKKIRQVSSLAMLNLNPKAAKSIETLIKKTMGFSKEKKAQFLKEELQLDEFEDKMIQMVDIDKINDAMAFKYAGMKNSLEDLEAAQSNDPLKVASVEGSKDFFLLDGFDVFTSLKQDGHSKVKVEIVGQAECLSQLIIARTMSMLSYHDNPSTMQFALGLLLLREELVRIFGKKYFNNHGGKRKKNQNKKGLASFISEILNVKRWAVATLLSFGLKVGPHALMGLQNHKEAKDLSIRSIQQLNGPIKEKKLGKMIEQNLNEMSKLDAGDEEMINQAGKVAFEFIMEIIEGIKPKRTTIADIQNTVAAMTYDLVAGNSKAHDTQKVADAIGNDENKIDAGFDDAKAGGEKGKIPPCFRDVSPEDIKQMKEACKNYFESVSNIWVCIKDKINLEKKESEHLYKMIEEARSPATVFLSLVAKTLISF